MPKILPKWICTGCPTTGQENFYSYSPTRCKKCIAKKSVARDAANPEDRRARKRRSDQRNRDKVQQRCSDYYQSNKEALAQKSLDAYHANHDENLRKMTERRLMREYGITLHQYEAMIEEQDGCCRICGDAENRGRRLCVDHCHETGVVRGLLCINCNMGIGYLADDIERLAAAIEYLSTERQ